MADVARDAVFDDTEFMACFFGKMRRTSNEWPTKRSTQRLVTAMRMLCNLAAVDRRFNLYATAQLVLLLHEAQAAIEQHCNLAEAHLAAYYTIEDVNESMSNFARSEQAKSSRAIVEMVYGFKHRANEAHACPSVLDQEISFFQPRSLSQLWRIVTRRSFVREELVESPMAVVRVMESTWYTHPYFDLKTSATIPNSFVSGGCYLPYTAETQVVSVAFGRRKEHTFVGKRRTLKFEYFVRPQVDDEPRPLDWHAVYLFRALRKHRQRELERKIKQLFERRDTAIVEYNRRELDPTEVGYRNIPNSEIVILHLPLLPFKQPLLGLPDETVADIFGLTAEQTIGLISEGCLISRHPRSHFMLP
jgi:hypothetical protein